MKFCGECKSIMKKITSTNGEIEFTCRCALPHKGNPDDTLIMEGYVETTESNLKYDVFIENSSNNLAKNIVMKKCLKCGIDYLTIIRIGINETTMYTCTCGFKKTHDEYNKAVKDI